MFELFALFSTEFAFTKAEVYYMEQKLQVNPASLTSIATTET